MRGAGVYVNRDWQAIALRSKELRDVFRNKGNLRALVEDRTVTECPDDTLMVTYADARRT